MRDEDTTSTVQDGATRVEAEYSHGHDRPLRGYAGTMATYSGVVTALSALVARRGGLPERIDGRDLALVAVATHKVSRLLAKDAVTSPVRAPFTRYEGQAEASEVREKARGEGAQHVVGELISCPFCTSQWVGTAFMFGLALAPRPTRFAAALFTTVSASDALQFAFARAQQST